MANSADANKYINLPGLETYTEEIKKLIRQMINESSDDFEIVTADTYLEFPLIGNEDKLYIDSGANKTYRWDDTNLKYYCVGSDYDDISQIDGTF